MEKTKLSALDHLRTAKLSDFDTEYGIEKIMKAMNCYKDGIDDDGVQLWSRDKGIETVFSDHLVNNGKLLVRFNFVKSTFILPGGMVSLIGSPRKTGSFGVKMSPGLISLEGIPRNALGTINLLECKNVNPMEMDWHFRDREIDENGDADYTTPKYTNYWKEYFEYVKEKILDSNLPKEYLEELQELDIVHLAEERSELRRNKAVSETGLKKFKL